MLLYVDIRERLYHSHIYLQQQNFIDKNIWSRKSNKTSYHTCSERIYFSLKKQCVCATKKWHHCCITKPPRRGSCNFTTWQLQAHQQYGGLSGVDFVWRCRVGTWRKFQENIRVVTVWGFPKMVGFPPKSSICHRAIGFSLINHPFWDTTIFGNTHI